jgi:hypothetical protein
MKSNFLKLVLPAFAIFMAVGLAFATEDNIVDQTAYYLHPDDGWQPIMVEDACFNGGSTPCEIEGLQLYAEPREDSQELYKN